MAISTAVVGWREVPGSLPVAPRAALREGGSSGPPPARWPWRPAAGRVTRTHPSCSCPTPTLYERTRWRTTKTTGHLLSSSRIGASVVAAAAVVETASADASIIVGRSTVDCPRQRRLPFRRRGEDARGDGLTLHC